jgi:hypothetical protein
MSYTSANYDHSRDPARKKFSIGTFGDLGSRVENSDRADATCVVS